jgi:hypothetical protein
MGFVDEGAVAIVRLPYPLELKDVLVATVVAVTNVVGAIVSRDVLAVSFSKCGGCGWLIPMVNTLDVVVVLKYPEELAPAADGVPVSNVVSLHVVVTSMLDTGLGALVVESVHNVVSVSSVQVLDSVSVAFDDG